jgi:exonuclease SbcC
MTEIDSLKDKIKSARTQWNALYETADISSEWVQEKTDEANTAIDNLGNVRDAYNQASYKLKEVSEKLTTCERDIARESNLLEDNRQKLDAVTVEIEGLTIDIENSVTRLRELLPDVFHGIGIEDAVGQFEDKIETVAAYEQRRDQKQNELVQCNIRIGERKGSLEAIRDNHGELQSEIEGYRNLRNRFLDAARDKTDGLTTEEEIDTAIASLGATIQKKADQREAAAQKLQESRNQRTEKQTNQQICQERRAGCDTHLATTKAAYFEKLSSAEFDSPEVHDSAFLADSEIQRIEKEIADFIQEERSLEEGIAILRAQFDKTPFDPQLLERIAAQVKEINAQIDEVQRDIGAEEKTIADLTDALSKREALDDEIQTSADELTRWKGLQDVIPANSLRDFALDIMFKQMGSLANSQLKYLTSERYQLKVEGIGKLTVVDRWNANEERPVETLSGGESFLTSLALALALSELSRGRSQIHSLFLDEGFGTLDSETLDVAIAALEGLQMQGRSIFLISHVGELTRRIPVRIAVQKSRNGSSQLRVHG